MASSSGYIHAGSQQLHYLCTGNGSRLAIAFHGYANDAFLFSFLNDPDFTVVSIDMPHHGKSDCVDDYKLEKKELVEMVHQLMRKHHATKISLIGYSMGGRVVLTLLELMPEYVDNVVLLAPDGLKFNYFYYFITRTKAGLHIYHDFMKRSTWYLGKVSLLKKLGWIRNAHYKFATQHLGTEDSRLFLHRVWKATNMLVPNLRKVKHHVNKYKIPVHICMGELDRVIPLKQAKVFIKGLPGVHLHVIQKGHAFLSDTNVQLFVSNILFGKEPRQ